MNDRKTGEAALHRPAANRDRQMLVLLGVFLVVLAVYALTGPGRIDTFDGQWRFDVARNLLRMGQPIVTTKFLVSRALTGRGGALYVAYGFAGSVAEMPFIALARLFDDPDEELARLFSTFTSPLFGAGVAAITYRFMRRLDVPPRRAIAWTLVSAFGSLLWPLASSTFDNAQHAFFVTLAAYLGFRAAALRSMGRALAAGLAAGMLINYQESFALILPALGLVVLASPGHREDQRDGWKRYAWFAAGCAVGLALWIGYNEIRFGRAFFSGRTAIEATRHPRLLGNPLAGISSLLVSPGRSIFLYSPTLILAFFGMRPLARRAPRLVLATVSATLIHLCFVGSLSLFAGEWCWGPRYLVAVLPLWALAFPFVGEMAGRIAWRRAVVVLGITLQLLGLSLDAMRFHAEHRLSDYFWAEQPWFYFRHSALVSRVGEIARTVREGVPRGAVYFAPTADPALVTLCPVRVWRPQDGPRMMRLFSMYYLPRPWPFWFRTIPSERRPIDPTQGVLFFAALGLLGGVLARAGLREEETNG